MFPPLTCGERLVPRQGEEYRGLRTRRYTYVRDLDGPWLLYDNQADPYQLTNLANHADHADLQKTLDVQLNKILATRGDKFLDGSEYVKQRGYKTKKTHHPIDRGLHWSLTGADAFESEFAESPIKRLGLEGLKRNARICLANIIRSA